MKKVLGYFLLLTPVILLVAFLAVVIGFTKGLIIIASSAAITFILIFCLLYGLELINGD